MFDTKDRLAELEDSSKPSSILFDKHYNVDDNVWYEIRAIIPA